MANFNVFTPMASTKAIAASAATANVALDRANEDRSLRVYNDLNEVVFITFGVASTLVATASDLPIGPKATEVFEINPKTSYVAAITASGSGNIYFTEGQGA